MTKSNLERLKESNSITSTSNWIEKAKWRQQNESWLDLSFKIATEILEALKAKKMTQAELALLIKVTPQQVNKIVKGNENLTLETIKKIEDALQLKLITPTVHYYRFSAYKNGKSWTEMLYKTAAASNRIAGLNKITNTRKVVVKKLAIESQNYGKSYARSTAKEYEEYQNIYANAA